jgi:hypothetical protein
MGNWNCHNIVDFLFHHFKRGENAAALRGKEMRIPEPAVKVFLFLIMLFDWLLPDSGSPEVIED